MSGAHVRREAWTIKLKRERLEEYVRHHAQVWPELEAEMRRHGIGDYSIWLFEPAGVLFQSLKYEGEDYDRDMAALAATEISKSWDALMAELQEPWAGEDGWAPMREVYRLD